MSCFQHRHPLSKGSEDTGKWLPQIHRGKGQQLGGGAHVKVLVKALEVELSVGGGNAHRVAGAGLNEVRIRQPTLVQFLKKVCVQRIWVVVLSLCATSVISAENVSAGMPCYKGSAIAQVKKLEI